MKASVRRIDLLKLSQAEIAGINHVIETSSAATVFHTLEWNRLLIEHFNLPYVALLAKRGQFILGLHVLFQYGDSTYRSSAINLQSVYGGPIAANDDPSVIQALLKESERLCPLAYFQLWSSTGATPQPFVQLGYTAKQMFTPIMKLDSPEDERWSRLDKDKRYKIRKAKAIGLGVEEAGIEDLEMYYQMVKETLCRANISALPLGYIKRVMTELQAAGMARLFVIRYNHEMISGSVVLYHKDTAYGWDIGWRREFARISPNDLLTWEIARNASDRGFRFFDLLRIEPDRLPGIAKWKETFGGVIVPCYLFRKETLAYRLFRWVRIVFTQPDRVIRKLRSRAEQIQ